MGCVYFFEVLGRLFELADPQSFVFDGHLVHSNKYVDTVTAFVKPDPSRALPRTDIPVQNIQSVGTSQNKKCKTLSQ